MAAGRALRTIVRDVPCSFAPMSTVFIVRRDSQRVGQARAPLDASRHLRVLGVAQSLYRARADIAHLDPDIVLIDLRLEDGAALSLVRELRERRADRPKAMLMVADPADPLLFCTLAAGADGYLLESDVALAAPALERAQRGEATMAPPLAWELLQFFGEPVSPPRDAAALDDRELDWRTDAHNPMKLSPGERRLAQMVARGMRAPELAAAMAISLESVGRRIGNIYRKLSWDVRSGSLLLLAA
jgi:DNA-binding NarL/FixJ family response regulator